MDDTTTSEHQPELELVPLDELVLLGEELGHVPRTVDIAPTKPLALLGREVDNGISADLRRVDKDCLG